MGLDFLIPAIFLMMMNNKLTAGKSKKNRTIPQKANN